MERGEPRCAARAYQRLDYRIHTRPASIHVERRKPRPTGRDESLSFRKGANIHGGHVWSLKPNALGQANLKAMCAPRCGVHLDTGPAISLLSHASSGGESCRASLTCFVIVRTRPKIRGPIPPGGTPRLYGRRRRPPPHDRSPRARVLPPSSPPSDGGEGG